MQTPIPNLPLNPYAQIDDVLCTRIQTDVSIEDKNLIRSVYPEHGIITLIINTSVHGLAEALRRRGITHYTSEGINEFKRIFNRLANFDTLGSDPDRHDSGRVESVRQPNPTTPDHSDDDEQSSKQRIRGVRRSVTNRNKKAKGRK